MTDWSDEKLILLGHLIGDGSYLSGQPMRYTTSSEENSEAVRSSVEQGFGAPVKRYAGQRSWHQLLISGNGNRWRPERVNKWLRELGIFNQRSYEKEFQPTYSSSAMIGWHCSLRHLWATDGCDSYPHNRIEHHLLFDQQQGSCFRRRFAFDALRYFRKTPGNHGRDFIVRNMLSRSRVETLSSFSSKRSKPSDHACPRHDN